MSKYLLPILVLLLLSSSNLTFSQVSWDFGAGNLTNNSSDQVPYGAFNGTMKIQYLIRCDEILESNYGIDTINSIAFDIVSFNGGDIKNLVIKMGATTQDELTNNNWLTGLSTVYQRANYTPIVGWNTHLLDSIYVHSGTENLVIEICVLDSNFNPQYDNPIFNETKLDFNGVLHYSTLSDLNGCNNPLWGIQYNRRANIRLNFKGQPIEDDLQIIQILEPISSCALTNSEPVTIRIKNIGNNPANNFQVSFNDGSLTHQESISIPLNPGDSIDYTFSSVADLATIGSYNFSAWVDYNNDQVACNDFMDTVITNGTPKTLFPYIEDFDITTVELVNQSNDDLNWIIKGSSTSGLPNSGTATPYTGPTFDHTFNQISSGSFLYIKSSFPNNPNKNAIIGSPCLDLSGLTTPYMEFWYYMYGSDMGNLDIEIYNITTGIWVNIWSKTGNQADQWEVGKIDLSAFAGQTVKYRFIGVTGTGPFSDIAIDDIKIYDKPAGDDLAIMELISPDQNKFCKGDSIDSLTVRVGNCGTTILQNFDLHYSINGGATITETANFIMNPSTDTVFTFSTGLNINTIGFNNIQIWVALNSDVDVTNDIGNYNIDVYALPKINLGNDTFICDGSGILFDLGPDYQSYNWNNGNSLLQSYATFNAGLVFVNIIDTNGCYGSDSIFISVQQPQPVDLGNDTSMCAGDSIIINAPAGYVNYWWNWPIDTTSFGNADTLHITQAIDSTIYLIVEDSNGCFNIDSMTITAIDTLTLNLGPDVVLCLGDTLFLDAGLLGATYNWSTGETTQEIAVTTSGTYFIEMQKCGFAYDTVIVNVVNRPVVNLGFEDTLVCWNDTLVLDAGIGPFEFDWVTSETTQTIEAKSMCKFLLEKRDLYGDGWNEGYLDLFINGTFKRKIEMLGPTNASEWDDFLVLAGDSYDLYWTPGDFASEVQYEIFSADTLNSFFSDAPNNNAGLRYTGVCPTEVWVQVIDTTTGCPNWDTVNIEFSFPRVDLGPDKNLCPGESVILDGGVFVSYLWDNGSVNQTITVSSAGTYDIEVIDTMGCHNWDTVDVIILTLPNVNLGPDTAVCDGEIFTFDAGAFDYFNWSTTDTTQTIDVNNQGQYSVEVTDHFGCINSDTVILTIWSLPVIGLLNDTSMCDPDSIILDAGNNGINYTWSTTETSQTITVDTSGFFSVIVEDVNACSNYDTIYVGDIGGGISVGLGNDTNLCFGSTLILDAGFGGADSYLWNTTETTQQITVTTSGIYHVDVTKCTLFASDTIQVVFNALPNVTLGIDQEICFDDTLGVKANGAFSYEWFLSYGDTISGTDSISVLIGTTGVFQIIVEGSAINGCSDRDTMNLLVNELPIIDLGPDSINCGSFVLDAANTGNSYLWNDNSSNQTLNATTTGTYSVVVTDTNGCSNSDDVLITINPYPIVSLGNDTVICNENSASLSPGLIFTSYLWNDSSTNQSLTVNSTGGYWVDVSNGFNCISRDSISVKFSALKLSLGNDTAVCGGYLLDIGTGYATYNWSTSDTTSFINILVSDLYVLTVTNLDGCVIEDTIDITINSLPNINLGGIDTICKGDTLTLNPGNYSSYLWSTSETSQTIDLVAAGTFYVDVVDVNGCIGSDTFKLVQKDCDISVVEWQRTTEIVQIFPNPTNGKLVFALKKSLGSISTLNIEILDLTGRLVHAKTWNTQQIKTIELDISDFASGNYLINLSIGDNRYYMPLIKE